MVSPETGKSSFTEQVTRIMEVRRKYEEELRKKPNVVGFGVGCREKDGKWIEGKVVLKVNVSRKVDPKQLEPDEVIPAVLEGIEIDVVEVGDLKAQEK